MQQQHHTRQLRYGFDESKYIDYNKSNKDEDKTVKRSNSFCQTPICVVSLFQKQSWKVTWSNPSTDN